MLCEGYKGVTYSYTVKSPSYTVNRFCNFPSKLKTMLISTVLKYDVFLIYTFISMGSESKFVPFNVVNP
jgi:hypothetical protein